MAIIFEYDYQIGETLRYQHITNLLFETPGAEPVVGRATYEHAEDVLAVSQGGIFTVEIRKSLLSSEGPLAAQISPEVAENAKRLRVDRSGRSYDVEEALPTRISFPVEPLDAGSSWENNLPGPGGSEPIAFKYIVERIAPEGEDAVAHLVWTGQGSGKDDDGTFQVDIRGTQAFSISQGCALRSQTVVTTTWASGTKSQAVVELALLDRVTHQLSSYEA